MKEKTNIIPLTDLIDQIESGLEKKPEKDQKIFPEPIVDEKEFFHEKNQYIRFFLGDIYLAIPLSSALEIGHRPDVTPLPNLPQWVLGVCNIRGEIVSVIDLKTFFNMPSLDIKGGSKMIVVHNKDMKMGLTVDQILGLINPGKIDYSIKNSPFKELEISSFISGVTSDDDEKILNILDVNKLMYSPEMTAFRTE